MLNVKSWTFQLKHASILRICSLNNLVVEKGKENKNKSL